MNSDAVPSALDYPKGVKRETLLDHLRCDRVDLTGPRERVARGGHLVGSRTQEALGLRPEAGFVRELPEPHDEALTEMVSGEARERARGLVRGGYRATTTLEQLQRLVRFEEVVKGDAVMLDLDAATTDSRTDEEIGGQRR